MSTMEALEAKMKQMERDLQKLKDIESIKQLKGKYLRLLDSKLWDEMGDCFTDDSTTSFSGGKFTFKGKPAIIKFFRENMPATMVSMHHGHIPEIQITSDTTATGIWGLEDYLIITNINRGLRGAAFYNDEYVKVNGEWKIKHTGYARIFEETWDRTEPKNCKITANMHQSSQKQKKSLNWRGS
jgi:bile-acid 7alpha-dehydratase